MDSKTSFYTDTGPVYESVNPASSSNNGEIVVTFDGGGSTLSAPMIVDLPISFGCTINSVTVVGDAVGSAAIGILKDTFANFPPVPSICSGTPPTLTSAQTYQDPTLLNWTTTVLPNDVLRFSLNSVSVFKRLTLTLQITKG